MWRGAIDDMPQVWGYMVVRPDEAFALAEAQLGKKVLLLAPVDEDTVVEATRSGIQLTVTVATRHGNLQTRKSATLPF